MKKIVLFLTGLFIINCITAQDDDIDKKWRFGISGAPSINWYQPDNEKKYESAGTVLKFGWGLDVERRLSKIVSIAFGAQFNYSGGMLNFKDTNYYYLNKDEELIEISKIDTSSQSLFRLNKRTYNMTYVNIPFMFKMRTKEIGYMTYYGELGLNTGFKYKGRANDDVTLNGNKVIKEDLDIEKDMNLIRMQVHIGGGAEYTISGSTALVFGLAYNLGVTNVVKKSSKHIFNTDGTAIKQNAVPNNVQLKVGVLF